jgi:hypothetical protein
MGHLCVFLLGWNLIWWYKSRMAYRNLALTRLEAEQTNYALQVFAMLLADGPSWPGARQSVMRTLGKLDVGHNPDDLTTLSPELREKLIAVLTETSA